MTPDVGHLEGRTIFVTGGAGFFGRHFAEAVLDHTRETKIVVYSRDEQKHARMAEYLRRHRDRLRFRLGDVRDPDRLRTALWKSDMVIHAAALKRVDDTAMHPYELIKTNCAGTQNVLEAALDAGAKKVLVISSDKGVLPANPYGATKFLAERLAIAWNAVSFARGQIVSCLRWGNVLGSTGSALHVFRRVIRAGEPITLTDGTMTRFWLSADQAVEGLCHVLRIMRGGEVFVYKTPAAPVGYLPAALASEAPVRYVAKRPGGEKIHEVLLSEHEADRAVELDDMYVIEPDWPLPAEREPWKGRALPEGFRYASDTAVQLRVEELAQMAAEVPDE